RNEQDTDERRGGREPPAPPRAAAASPLGARGIPHDRPAVTRWSQRGQRLELRHALVQRFKLCPAGGAFLDVSPCPNRRLARLQRQQIIHRTVHHACAPSASPNRRRSRAWARASCDFEKL